MRCRGTEDGSQRLVPPAGRCRKAIMNPAVKIGEKASLTDRVRKKRTRIYIVLLALVGFGLYQWHSVLHNHRGHIIDSSSTTYEKLDQNKLPAAVQQVETKIPHPELTIWSTEADIQRLNNKGKGVDESVSKHVTPQLDVPQDVQKPYDDKHPIFQEGDHVDDDPHLNPIPATQPPVAANRLPSTKKIEPLRVELPSTSIANSSKIPVPSQVVRAESTKAHHMESLSHGNADQDTRTANTLTKVAQQHAESILEKGKDSQLPVDQLTVSKHVEESYPSDVKETKEEVKKKETLKPQEYFMDMYKDGFTGDFVMNKAKYKRVPRGSPVRVAKYKIQCLWKNPPRGCDLDAAKRDPPRGRGWQRVASTSREFLNLLPDIDPLRDAPKFSSCALVGNGGSLLLARKGGEIDAHEAVIRFNGGVTRGFEQYVGQKTTLRLTNTQHMGFHESINEVVLQHITMERAIDKLAEVKNKHPKLKIYAADGDFHQYVLDTMEEGAASNGFFGMVLAYERCESVTVYGFHKDWKETAGKGIKVKYHYYDDVEPNESQTKRDDAEAPKFQEFIAKHSGKFKIAKIDTERQ